jgi:hypothetical protein
MLEKKLPDKNNTMFGLKRMLNTLKLLKPLMKPVSSFNTYPSVPHSLKLNLSMKLSLRDSMKTPPTKLSLSPLLSLLLNSQQTLIRKLSLELLNYSLN